MSISTFVMWGGVILMVTCSALLILGDTATAYVLGGECLLLFVLFALGLRKEK